jgi:Rod binding domain-containing protein
MQQQPTIQDVADQLEQLLIRIMLAVLRRLTDEIAGFNSEDDVKF